MGDFNSAYKQLNSPILELLLVSDRYELEIEKINNVLEVNNRRGDLEELIRGLITDVNKSLKRGRSRRQKEGYDFQ
ncbi:14423_t:CDS:2 [Entrophospora sp. SA101]|nr:14423_t:CDS:2 [Entrophospora sp. SA101]